MILQVVDEFGVFAVGAGEDVFEFEDGGVELDGAVGAEDGSDGAEDAVTEEDVSAGPVSGAFGRFELEGEFFFFFSGHCSGGGGGGRGGGGGGEGFYGGMGILKRVLLGREGEGGDGRMDGSRISGP